MDRFLMHVRIDYPAPEHEIEVIRLVRGEERHGGGDLTEEDRIPEQAVFDVRSEIRDVQTSAAIDRYIVDLITATRNPGAYSEEIGRWVSIGASPRGCLALDKASRAHAWLQDRDQVLPDDVRAIVHDCLRHRIKLSYEANADGISSDDVIRQLVELVAVA